jgi:hypothetical protein
MNKLLNTGLASVLALAAAGAIAQAPGNPPAQPRGQGPMMDRTHRADTRAMKPADRAEARLAYLRTALKITPAQEPQWNAYANFVRKATADAQQRFDQLRTERANAQRPNAIERLQRQQSMAQEQSRRLGELIAVQKPLYDSLSPDQKKVADEVLGPQRMFAHRGGHGGPGPRRG